MSKGLRRDYVAISGDDLDLLSMLLNSGKFYHLKSAVVWTLA